MPGKCSIRLEVATIVECKVMVHRTVCNLLALTFTHHFGLLDDLLDETTTSFSLNGLVNSAHAHVRSADITRVWKRVYGNLVATDFSVFLKIILRHLE